MSAHSTYGEMVNKFWATNEDGDQTAITLTKLTLECQQGHLIANATFEVNAKTFKKQTLNEIEYLEDIEDFGGTSTILPDDASEVGYTAENLDYLQAQVILAEFETVKDAVDAIAAAGGVYEFEFSLKQRTVASITHRIFLVGDDTKEQSEEFASILEAALIDHFEIDDITVSFSRSQSYPVTGITFEEVDGDEDGYESESDAQERVKQDIARIQESKSEKF